MTMSDLNHDRFEAAAEERAHCRIIYKDDHGEHHAMMAVPNERHETGGVAWGFFTSEAGEVLEIRLEDILAIELLEA